MTRHHDRRYGDTRSRRGPALDGRGTSPLPGSARAAALLAAATLLLGCGAPAADLVFRGGPVYTADPLRPWAEAVAVQGRDIVYVGDGLATSMASLLGGPPNTTYSEVTGAVTLTRAFNPAIMTWAALWAIALSFIGKLGAVLQTIPTPVMGGILVLLFGAITVVGLSSLMGAKDDLTKPRNLIIISMILVLGIGGMEIPIGNFALGGIGLAGVVGVLLNLFLPRGKDAPERAVSADAE